MKKLRFISGVALGLILGGAFGLFVATPVLTIFLRLIGIIKSESGPPWIGTLIAFLLFLSINMGIYLGIKWARRSGNNKAHPVDGKCSNS